jgi:hypothetical protein
VPDGRRGLGARAARRVREACTQRLTYKAAALIVSGVLWLVVRGEQPATAWLTVRVEPALDGRVQLAAPAPQVRVLVSGPVRELLALGAQPPVLRRAVAGDAPTSVQLALVPDDVELPPGAARVRVRDLRPRAVTLRLARTEGVVRPGAATAAAVRP